MKLRLLTLVCAMTGVAAIAAETDPQDVTYDDYGAIEASLTGAAGDAANGALIVGDKSKGNCVACHAVTVLADIPFHGEVGPELDGVADRWEPAELRAILVDSKEVFGEQTIMPGFYTLNVGKDVRKDLVGKTILTAEQIEHVVAYLTTLKE